jgi:hypothetical protein
MRLISKRVPSNQMAGGKNSAIDGVWNPDSPSAASGRIVARLDRAVSWGSKAPTGDPGCGSLRRDPAVVGGSGEA